MKKAFGSLLSILFLCNLALVLVLTACGGGGGDNNGGGGGGSGTGSVLLSLIDAPLDNLVKFEITIVAVELDPGNVQVLPSPVRVEVTSAQLTSKVIRLADSIAAGNYSSVTIQFSNPEIKFCPENTPCTSPTTLTSSNLTLVNSTVTKNVSLTVPADGGVGLVLDFDLAASVQTNAIGTITGVDPQVTVSVQNLGNQEDEFEAKGRVRQVNGTAASGNFLLQVFGSCQQITVQVGDATEYEDFDDAGLANSFSALAVDQIVEVKGDATTGGGLFANAVELEEPDDDIEAEGTIVARVVDANGFVSSFTLLVQELTTCEPNALNSDLVNVMVTTGTGATVFFMDENDLPGVDPTLFNDRRDLAVGQKVEVEPTSPLVSTSTSITAKKIKLKQQIIRGLFNFASSSTAFTMFPQAQDGSSEIFPDPNNTIDVEVFPSTEFSGVSDVSGLIQLQQIRVRGFVFLVEGQYEVAASKVEAEPIT